MKMRVLEPSEFAAWRNLSIKNYSEGMAINNGLPVSAVLEEATKQFDRSFPQGYPAADNEVYQLVDDHNKQLGYLWLGINGPSFRRRVFIFDIFVEESERKKGYGEFMLGWLEQKTKELGHHEISLHAFNYNRPAISLYEKFGYQVTNVYMTKKL